MSTQLTREHVEILGRSLERLLVMGQPAAIVAAVREEAADLFVSYYGHQWKWWALIGGVTGGPWLLRNADDHRISLVLEPEDEPVLIKASWDAPHPSTKRPKVRVGRRPKVPYKFDHM